MSKMKDIETRTFRAQLSEDSGAISGYAAVFNEYSVDLGGFTEIISPGAFTEAIGRDDVRALLNHNPDYVLGRNRSETLRMVEDARGLRVEIDLPPTTWANDLRESMKRGDINQMSFQFRSDEDEWRKDEERGVVHELHKASLLDVSVVTFPAYPQTSAMARSIVDTLANEDIGEPGEQELPTRQDGYSRHIDLLDKMR